jgi:hypothetical protein
MAIRYLFDLKSKITLAIVLLSGVGWGIISVVGLDLSLSNKIKTVIGYPAFTVFFHSLIKTFLPKIIEAVKSFIKKRIGGEK